MHHIAPIERKSGYVKRGEPLNPRITKRMRHALELYITGEAKTQAAAADKAGLSRERFCRALKQGHIQAFITQRSAEMFSALLPKAVRALDMVLDGGNEGARLNGALAVLRQHGIVSQDGPSVAVTVNAPGYVIDLSGGRQIAEQPIIDANALSQQADVPSAARGTRQIGHADASPAGQPDDREGE